MNKNLIINHETIFHTERNIGLNSFYSLTPHGFVRKFDPFITVRELVINLEKKKIF